MWEDLSISTRSIPYQPVLTRLQASGLDLNNIGSITKFWDAEKVKHEIKKFSRGLPHKKTNFRTLGFVPFYPVRTLFTRERHVFSDETPRLRRRNPNRGGI